MSLNGMRFGGSYKVPLTSVDRIKLSLMTGGSLLTLGTLGYLVWRFI